jgi:hypothetical protein
MMHYTQMGSMFGQRSDSEVPKLPPLSPQLSPIDTAEEVQINKKKRKRDKKYRQTLRSAMKRNRKSGYGGTFLALGTEC